LGDLDGGAEVTRGALSYAEFERLKLGTGPKPKAARKRGAPKKKSEKVARLLLHLKALGLPEPVEEHRFHPRRMWRFDLAWPAVMVACEVDGGVFSKSRHTTGKGFTEDCCKLNEAALLGWRVLRVTPEQVRTGEALTWVKAMLRIPTGQIWSHSQRSA
jgi:hypothetical protein